MLPHSLCSIVITCVALVSGWSHAEPVETEPQPLHVVVRVNGRAITVEQIQHVIGAQIEGMPAEQIKHVVSRVLQELINEELLVQSAVAAELDRDPAVQQSMNAELRRVLAHAYVERLAQKEPKSRQQEIRQFYNEHPVLFKQRRIYQVHHLFAVVPPDQRASLQLVVAKSSAIAEVAEWLAAKGYDFKETAGTWPAEQIPMDVLQPLAEMPDSKIELFDTSKAPETVLTLQLVHATDAAMSEAQASPHIEQLLLNRSRSEAGVAEIKRLREAARIEYPGRSAQEPPSPDTRPNPSAPKFESMRQQEAGHYRPTTSHRRCGDDALHRPHQFNCEGESHV